MQGQLITGDCLEVMRGWQDNSVDLVITSPPYEDARTYGIDFTLKGDEWVTWAADRFEECVRVCRGLVAWVVEGKTRKFRYSATPLKLAVELDRRGVHLRKPPIFHRVGIPGSGGPDWWRNDYEFVICGTSGGKLPWSDNVATGNPTKYDEGGACTNRKVNGERVGYASRDERQNGRKYAKPKSGIANPGNAIEPTYTVDEVDRMLSLESDYLHCTVGKGHMGHDLAHNNEAPFPEALVYPFVVSFCPPDGIVCDPFCGSGTVPAVAKSNGRDWVGIDIRQSQTDLTLKRTRDYKAR